MMRYILISLILFGKCSTKEYQKKDSTLLFPTIELIVNNYGKEVNGEISKKIANDVFYLVYEESNIDLESKLDLLYLMVTFQRNSTKAYRAKVRSLIKQKNTNVIESKIILIPISICYYCDSTIVDVIDNDILNHQLNLSPEYKTNLEHLMVKIIRRKKSKENNYLSFNTNIKIFVESKLIKKYGVTSSPRSR